MPLLDENSGMMDTLRQPKLVYTSLKSAFQEIFHLQRQYVIELHARLIEYSHANESTDEGIAFEKAFGFFLVEREKLTAKRSALVLGLCEIGFTEQLDGFWRA